MKSWVVCIHNVCRIDTITDNVSGARRENPGSQRTDTSNKPPGSQRFLKRFVVVEPVKRFPTFIKTENSIGPIVFTNASCRALFLSRSFQSILPYPVSLRFILLSSHLCLGHLAGLSRGFLTKIYVSLFSPHALYHLIPLNLNARITFYKEYKLWASHYVVFYILTYFPLSCVQIFYSTHLLQ